MWYWNVDRLAQILRCSIHGRNVVQAHAKVNYKLKEIVKNLHHSKNSTNQVHNKLLTMQHLSALPKTGYMLSQVSAKINLIN